jgi:cytosine/adenosine deaminase-related metal-dependent hydrolase
VTHPRLRISELDGGVRLGLDGFSYVEGATLQEAADELVRRVLVVAMAFRASGIGPMYSECRADPGALDLIWNLGEVAAAGGDIRDHLFGPEPPTPWITPAG